MLALALALVWLTGCTAATGADRKQVQEKRVLSLLQLGEALLFEGENTAALNQLLLARELAPKNALVHNYLSLAYLGKQEYALAEDSVKKALALNPEMTEAHNNLGLIYMEGNRFDEAIAEFRICLADAEYQGAYKAYNNIGVVHLTKGEHQEAIALFKESLAAFPKYSVAYNNLGQADMALGDYRAAVENFSLAVQISPKYIRAYMNLGEALERLEYYEEAADMYNKAASLAGPGPTALEAKSRARGLAAKSGGRTWE